MTVPTKKWFPQSIIFSASLDFCLAVSFLDFFGTMLIKTAQAYRKCSKNETTLDHVILSFLLIVV